MDEENGLMDDWDLVAIRESIDRAYEYLSELFPPVDPIVGDMLPPPVDLSDALPSRFKRSDA
jgi:hypothetical protein